MKHKIITISRQCGSGGHTIGKEVAERLNIPFYDKKLLELVAARSGLSEKVIEAEGEYSTSSMLFNLAMGVASAYDLSKKETMPLREQVNAYQTEIIQELAEQGPCVIVGRCADYILREKADCFNVFVYGNVEDRAKRVITEYQIPESESKEHVRSRDRKRAKHYKYITDQNWGDATNYNLCLDSSYFGIEKCVEMLLFSGSFLHLLKKA